MDKRGKNMSTFICMAGGYGAFSYAKSQVGDVVRYIQQQESHHAKRPFLDEYKKFLDAFEVEWDERYIFKEPE